MSIELKTCCPIPLERLVEDLRHLDVGPPQLDGWGRNRCKWGAEALERLTAEQDDLRGALKVTQADRDKWFSEARDRRRQAQAAEALLQEARQALTKIAEGLTPPEQHGHYLAHREAVRIAREALRGPTSETKQVVAPEDGR